MATITIDEYKTRRGRMTTIRHHGAERCYACDGRMVGLRDRRPEGLHLEPACARHMDPRIRLIPICIFCDWPVRSGSLEIDGRWIHAKCHAEQCRN